ncbi:MAG: RNA-guided endonuclease TnpB family protein, partial [Waterburya sp.]
KLTTRLVAENQSLAVEDLNVSGMVKNRKLSRAISDAGWSKFKTMLQAKCDKYGRDLTIVDRWYPSSQICSCCGKSGGKKELDVREWSCLFCNTIHDRDINAAENLNRYHKGISEGVPYAKLYPLGQGHNISFRTMWAGGQSDQYKYGRGVSVSQAKLAVCGEASTTPKQLTLF